MTNFERFEWIDGQRRFALPASRLALATQVSLKIEYCHNITFEYHV